MQTNDRTNWERRLAGATDVPTHDGFPDYGFYRVRSRDKQTWSPVAYWYTEEGALRCRMGARDLDEQRAQELWTYACRNPISHELYMSVVAGGPWPDLSEAVTRSNQAPPDDSFDALQDRIADLAREADKIAEIKTQDEANQAADLANKLGELQGTADEVRAAEKKPHDDAARAVQSKWKPVIDGADLAKRKLKGVIAKFLTAKEAAERAAREQAARAGTPAPEPEQRVSTTKAGTRGRAVALRTVKSAKIADYDKCLAYFAKNAKVVALVQELANAAVRQGTTPDGCELNEEKVAA